MWRVCVQTEWSEKLVNQLNSWSLLWETLWWGYKINHIYKHLLSFISLMSDNRAWYQGTGCTGSLFNCRCSSWGDIDTVEQYLVIQIVEVKIITYYITSPFTMFKSCIHWMAMHGSNSCLQILWQQWKRAEKVQIFVRRAVFTQLFVWLCMLGRCIRHQIKRCTPSTPDLLTMGIRTLQWDACVRWKICKAQQKIM